LTTIEDSLRDTGVLISVENIARPRIDVGKAALALAPPVLNVYSYRPEITIAGPVNNPYVPIAISVSRGVVEYRIEGNTPWIRIISGETGFVQEGKAVTPILWLTIDDLPDGIHMAPFKLIDVKRPQQSILITVILRKSRNLGFGPRLVLRDQQMFDSSPLRYPTPLSIDAAPGLILYGHPPALTSGPPTRFLSATGELQVEFRWEAKGPDWQIVEPSQGVGRTWLWQAINFRARTDFSGYTPGRYSGEVVITNLGDPLQQIRLLSQLRVYAKPSDYFSILDRRSVDFFGRMSGPFKALRSTIEVVSSTGRPVKWELSNVPAWLDVTSTSGTTPSVVTLMPNQRARELAPGNYSTYLEFRNNDGWQLPEARIVSLTITR
jgi:hypothetical protein